MNEPDLDRRTVFGGIGIGASALLAGCLSDPRNGDSERAAAQSDQPVELSPAEDADGESNPDVYDGGEEPQATPPISTAGWGTPTTTTASSTRRAPTA